MTVHPFKKRTSLKRLFSLCLLAVILTAVPGCGRIYQYKINRAEDEIVSLIRLSGYEYTFKEILYFGEEKSILGLKFADKGFLASLDMVLTAGYDLEEGFHIRADSGSKVTVYLPPPRILKTDADETSIREYYSYQRGEAITHMDLYKQIEAVKPELEKEAVERGILKRAEENVQILVGELLLSLGFEEVRFETVNGGYKE